MRIDLPLGPKPAFFEAVLEPTSDIRERSGADCEAELRVLFSKINRVVIYDLSVDKMTEMVDQKILERLELKWSEPPSLLVVCTHLGCLPDYDCKFTWLRVGFDLGREIPERGLRPVVCKMYPEDSRDPIKVAKSFEISSTLDFKILEAATPELSGKKTEQSEYESYQYQLSTVGRMGPSPAWDFRTTDVHPEITGDFMLMMIIAMKPGLNTTGEISISAKAQLRSGWLNIPLVTRQTSEGAIKKSFALSGSGK